MKISKIKDFKTIAFLLILILLSVDTIKQKNFIIESYNSVKPVNNVPRHLAYFTIFSNNPYVDSFNNYILNEMDKNMYKDIENINIYSIGLKEYNIAKTQDDHNVLIFMWFTADGIDWTADVDKTNYQNLIDCIRNFNDYYDLEENKKGLFYRINKYVINKQFN